MRGFLLLLFIVMLAGCKKELIGSDIPPVDPLIPATDSFYFRSEFNGINVAWKGPLSKDGGYSEHKSAPLFGRSDLGNQGSETFRYYLMAYSGIIKNDPANRPRFEVGFNMVTPSDSRAEFLSWFSPGVKVYSTRSAAIADIYDPSRNGVVVAFIAEDGTQWSTNRGSQQGSYFESISLTDLTGKNNGYMNKIWKARFSCRMYDQAGNYFDIKNAEIYNWIMVP